MCVFKPPVGVFLPKTRNKKGQDLASVSFPIDLHELGQLPLTTLRKTM